MGVFLWDIDGDLSEPITFYPQNRDNLEITWDKNGDFIYMHTSGLLQDVDKGIPFGTDFDHKDLVLDGVHPSGSWEPYQPNLHESPDGSRTLTIEENNIVLWDNTTQIRLHEFPGSFEEENVAFMNHGENIVAVEDSKAFVWDANTFELIKTVAIVPDGRRAYGIRFTPTRSYIVTMSWQPSSRIIQVTNINTGELHMIDSFTEGSVFAFSHDRKKAFVVEEFVTHLLDMETWTYTTVFENPDEHSGHETLFHSPAAFSPDDSMIAYHNSEHYVMDIYLYDVNTGEIVKTIETKKPRRSWNDVLLQFSPDGQILIAVQNEVTDVFDVQSSERILHFDYASTENDPSQPYKLADVYVPSPDFTKITLAFNERIERWDMENQTRLCVLEPVAIRGGGIIASPNGLAYARFPRSRELYHFDLSRCDHLRPPQEFEQNILYFHHRYKFSEDEEWMLGFDGADGIWYHVPTNRIIQTYHSTSFFGITNISLGTDNHKAYLGRYDGTVVELELPKQSHVEKWSDLQ
jgi:WD40 repeat protein